MRLLSIMHIHFQTFSVAVQCGFFSCVSIYILSLLVWFYNLIINAQIEGQYSEPLGGLLAWTFGSCFLPLGSLLPLSMFNSPKEEFSNCLRNLYEVCCSLPMLSCTNHVHATIAAGKRTRFLPNLFSLLGICTIQGRYISLSPLSSFFSFLFSVATC